MPFLKPNALNVATLIAEAMQKHWLVERHYLIAALRVV
jgi:hypothetical protein